MSTVKATFSGFVGFGGVPVELHEGDVYDADNPLVAAHSDKFTAPPEPKRSVGRPLGSKNRPKDEDE